MPFKTLKKKKSRILSMIIHCSIAFDECRFNEMSFSQGECGEKTNAWRIQPWLLPPQTKRTGGEREEKAQTELRLLKQTLKCPF